MSLSAAAAALGLPESLVQRSAAARAAETGASVEEILAAWAGGETTPAPAATASEPSPSDESAAVEPPATDEGAIEEVPAVDGDDGNAVTIPQGLPTRAPVPASVTPAEAAQLPEVITVPTAGIKERTNFVIPRWLTSLLLIAPAFALFALGGAATGACGEGTELATDVITGEIVNCDGTEFTGGGLGGGGTDFVALGGQIYAGTGVTGVNCFSCHAPSGQGSGTFPALTGVLTTFGACADHIEWVTLGTDMFLGSGRSTYGDTAKPVGAAGKMPSFAASLTPEQIAAVVAFERVRFGGASPEETLIDCGLVEAEPETPAGEGGTGDSVPGGETEPEASSRHSG